MFQEKKKVLSEAPNALNKNDQPWEVNVEEDMILARFKWWDAGFFSPQRINNELKQYIFKVTLDDRGKWHELDYITNSGDYVGNVRRSRKKEFFVGKTVQKTVTFELGKGKPERVYDDLDTAVMKRSVRAYLSGCGWKKAGLFG